MKLNLFQHYFEFLIYLSVIQFLHSVGIFHFYDPISKILFSGDVGASMSDKDHDKPVEDFSEHVKIMEGLHKRYMVSNTACRHWSDMCEGPSKEKKIYFNKKCAQTKGAILAPFLWDAVREKGELS